MSQEKICKKAADTLIRRKGTKLQQDDSIIQILTENCRTQLSDPENYKKFKEPRFGDCCAELDRAATYHGFSSQLANMSSLTPEQIRAALSSFRELPGISKVDPVSVRRQAKAAEQNPRALKFHQNREEYAGLLHKYIQPSMDELTQKNMRAKIAKASNADKKTIDDHGATAMAFSHKEFLKNLIVVHNKFEAEARQQQLRVNQELPEERAREALTTEEKEKKEREAYWEAFYKLVDETVAARGETVAATVLRQETPKPPVMPLEGLQLVQDPIQRRLYKNKHNIEHDDFDLGKLPDGTHIVIDNITKKVYRAGKKHKSKGKTYKAKGKSHKAKGKTYKAKGKSRKTKGKSHKAKGKSHKAKGKSHKAKGKSHKAKGKRKTRKH